MKNYDEIIGKVINSLVDLKGYVRENESKKMDDVSGILEQVMKLDEFMTYGDESEDDSSLDSSFGYPLQQVDEIVAEFKMIVDKRIYQRLYKEDTQLFVNSGKHNTEDEFIERNQVGVAIEEILENKYGKSLVSSWRNEL